MEAIKAAQQQLINQFMITCRNIGLIDSASTRGGLNKIVTDHATVIVQSQEFQSLVGRMNKSRDRGEDRICLSLEEFNELCSDLDGKVPSSRMWMSLLTTMGYAVMETFDSPDIRLMIAW